MQDGPQPFFGSFGRCPWEAALQCLAKQPYPTVQKISCPKCSIQQSTVDSLLCKIILGCLANQGCILG